MANVVGESEGPRGLLLGPGVAGQPWTQSESDIPGPVSPEPLPSSEITYSEPALDEQTQELLKQVALLANGPGRGSASVGGLASSGTERPVSALAAPHAHPHPHFDVRFAPTPTNSLADALQNVGTSDKSPSGTHLTGGGEGGSGGGGSSNLPQNLHPGHIRSEDHKESFTEADYHSTVQTKYRQNRRRHFTDPVDFEGILHIIGGCGWWQIWIYLLISLQQVPHSMFNLSVVYMMFQPDHWCKTSAFSEVAAGGGEVGANWTAQRYLSSGIIFPMEENRRYLRNMHSQCERYDYSEEELEKYVSQPFGKVEAQFGPDSNVSRPPVVSCRRLSGSGDYDKAVMDDTIVTQWNLYCEDGLHRADAQLAYSLGYLVGCLISGLSSDRFGRKPTVIGFGVLASMFGIILPYSTYFPMFLLLRFLSAVCNEAADLAAYVLCMEITGTKYRAMVGSFLQAPWAIGYALLAAVAYLTRSWRIMQIITAALHTVTILLICVLPESPRWLIVNNRVREAERIIRKACRMNKSQLPADLELVKHAENRLMVKRHKRAHLGHLLKSRVLLMRTGIVFVIWVATALVYYGLVIALSDQSGPGRELFSGNFFVNNAVAGAIELPTLLGCVFLLRFGRKKSQMSTLVLAGFMIIVGMMIPQHRAFLRLTFMMLAKVFIQAAFNILYIFTSELYPTVIRNSAVGTSSMVARLGAGVCGYVAILSDVTVPLVPLIIFGVFSLVAAAMVLFLPETRDKPLPDTLQDAVSFLKADNSHMCIGGPSISEAYPPVPRGVHRGGAGQKNHQPVRTQRGETDATRSSDSGYNSGTNGGAQQQPPPQIQFSACDDQGILRDLQELDLPSHPDKLPEACSEGTLVGSPKNPAG